MTVTVNSPSGGNDDTHPSDGSIDSLLDFDLDEPEVPANPQGGQEQIGDESETDASPEEALEAEQPDDENEDDDLEQPIAVPVKDDVVITLSTGESVPLAELKAGYMKDKDYRQKTEAVANSRKELEATSTRVSQSAEALANYLVSKLPAPPDPALAYTNPSAHYSQKFAYDSALAEIQNVLNLAGAPKEVVKTISKEQQQAVLEAENQKLSARFPQIANPEKRERFFKEAFATGKELGFTDAEIANTTDSRLFAVIHYAKIGLRALQNRNIAQGKVQNVPPVNAPRRQAVPNAEQQATNRKAVDRLSRTGTIDDAMAVSFDF